MAYLMMVLVLSGLILVHEAGHFLAARLMGLPVEIFSIGFGPKLVGITRQGTEYRISWIPLGGYVLPRLATAEDYFQLSRWHRAFFSLGGPVANFLIAAALYAGWWVAQGHGGWGVLVAPWSWVAQQTQELLLVLPRAFCHPQQLSGIVGMVAQGGHWLQQTGNSWLLLAALLSVNLGVLNLLPVPGLDGGKLGLLLMETCWPRSQRWQLPVTVTGMVLLFGMMIYLVIQDLGRLWWG